MNIHITCENCGITAEFSPEKNEEIVKVRKINSHFLVGVNWKNEVIENIQKEFVEELGQATSNEERKEILENRLTKNAFAETIDFEVSFTCRNCGDRLTLNEFPLIDIIGF